ncbi:hypothetical protein [Cupriavidus sp. TMH.W2]|uniref:hypothetical protein n=1 Tax=Cupriavidus sp. TMH.W2 TaxID=3434465 RepID=UPI003D77F753
MIHRDPDLIEAVEAHFIRLLAEGKIQRAFPADPTEYVRRLGIEEPYKVAQYFRRARDGYHLPPDLAIRVALVCVDLQDTMQLRRAAALAAQRNAQQDAQRALALEANLGAAWACLPWLRPRGADDPPGKTGHSETPPDQS